MKYKKNQFKSTEEIVSVFQCQIVDILFEKLMKLVGLTI